MPTLKINGELYKQLVINGAANLRANYKAIDALNVFPVPDGDTGTNMRMTIEAGANSLKDVNEDSVYEVSKIASRGMLMGARGNSGVILSQLFRGIYKGLTDIKEATVKDWAKAFQSGVNQAYHAVLKPVEGTILTVAREASEKAYKTIKKNDSLEKYFDIYLTEARASLQRTPDLLPVLKEAGVVDSGGAGFICVVEGMQKYLNGEEIVADETIVAQSPTVNRNGFNADSVLEFGYCTEFILQLQNSKVDFTTFNIKEISDWLETIGNSIVALQDEDIVKVHVHTKDPGLVLSHCQKWGEYITLKIENMQVSHNEGSLTGSKAALPAPDINLNTSKPKEHKKFAIVAVASGSGLTNIFKEMGVDYVVSGGQSMNPSAEDFVQGFDQLDAENILVFPNNSNIVLAAQQAAKYYDKANIVVVPSKTLAQGYSALTMLDLSSEDVDTILEEIKEVIDNVTTGLITYSIRDTEFEDVRIHKDDYIGICNGKIVVSEPERLEAVKGLFENSDIAEKEIVTIITGKDAVEEETQAIQDYINETYPNVEIDLIEGDQDIYCYIFSIE